MNMLTNRETILHPEFVKKYFSHPKHLMTISKDCLERAKSDLEDGGSDWKYNLAKIQCMLKDYFKTEGLDPEAYLMEMSRYRGNE